MMSDAVRPDRQRPLRTGLAVVLCTAVMGALVLVAPPWMRAAAAVLWVLVVPGLPWAVRMRAGDRGDTAALAVAVSLALAAVVGGGMAVLGTWSPVGAVAVLLGVSLCALLPGVPSPFSGRNHDLRRYEA